jgi:hypothetical protein
MPAPNGGAPANVGKDQTLAASRANGRPRASAAAIGPSSSSCETTTSGAKASIAARVSLA